MANLENVKVGDKLLLESIYRDEIIEVTRITKTLVICGNSRYNKSNGKSCGDYSFYSSYVRLATEDDIRRVKLENRRRNMINFIKNYNDYTKLSYDELEKVYNILKNSTSNIYK